MTNGHALARPPVDRHLTMATTPNKKPNGPRPQARPQADRPDEQHPGEAATPLLATKLWRTSRSSPTQQCAKGRSSRSSTIRVVAHAENGDRGNRRGLRQPTIGRIAAQAWTSELRGSGRAETGKSPGSAPSHPSGMRPPDRRPQTTSGARTSEGDAPLVAYDRTPMGRSRKEAS
jgi:hypothetical protein